VDLPRRTHEIIDFFLPNLEGLILQMHSSVLVNNIDFGPREIVSFEDYLNVPFGVGKNLTRRVGLLSVR